MAQNEKIEIQIEIDFNGLNSCDLGEIISNIMKYLLHQRYQIPFNFSIFDRIVDSFKDRSANELEHHTELTKYKILRQRELATQTRDDIQCMNKLIKDVFHASAVKTIRFGFGANTFLPREVYSVHIPIECWHVKTDYKPVCIPLLNSIMLKLIANEQLSNVFAHKLCPTNTFMEIELWHDFNSPTEHPKLQRKTVGELPKACKNVHLDFVHKSNIMSNQLIVYEDANEDLPEKDKNNDSHINTLYSARTDVIEPLGSLSHWWEAFPKIKGLKELDNKKLNIW